MSKELTIEEYKSLTATQEKKIIELTKAASEGAAKVAELEAQLAEANKAVAELSEQLSQKEESLASGKVLVKVSKKTFEIVSKKIRVAPHVEGKGKVKDWPKILKKTTLTAIELSKEKEYLEFLVSQNSCILSEVTVKEK